MLFKRTITEHSRLMFLAGALALVAALAGCGSSSSSGSSNPNGNPATLAPESAPIYLEAVVKPTGELKQAANTSLRTLTHKQNPYASIVHALEGSPFLDHVNYNEDIKPWLGARLGLFITSLSIPNSAGSSLKLEGTLSAESILSAAESILPLTSKDLQGALVLDVADSSKARSFVESQSSAHKGHSVTYKATTYDVDSEGIAWGLVGDYVVIGSESGIRAAIDTKHGAPALPHAPGYSKLVALEETNVLAGLYVDKGALASSHSSVAGLSELEDLLPEAQQAHLSVVPTDTSLALDIDSTPGSPTPGKEASLALGNLPGSSWLAIGTSKLGTSLPRDLSLISKVVSLGSSSVLSSIGGPGIASFLEQLETHKSELKSELAGWAGPAGLFVSGSGLFDLQGGLVVDSSDPARSKEAVASLSKLFHTAGAAVAPTSIPGTEAAATVRLTGFPLTFDMASGQGKFVIGIGASSVTGALKPSSTFSTSAGYVAATATLDHKGNPILVVEFPTLVGFIEGLGLGEDPGISGAMPYLRSLATLVGGVQQLEGGVIRQRIILGLQQAEGQPAEG